MFSIKFKLDFARLLWIALGFFAAYIIHSITRVVFNESFNIIAIFCFTAILFYNDELYKKRENTVNNVLIGVILFLAMYFTYHLVLTYFKIPEFDFLCFYLFGKTGITHTDFYNPQIYQQEFNNLNLQSRTGSEFYQEIVNVGFWYPPPSMFLFLILGVFNLETGYFIWQTLVIMFLLISIVLLARYYLLHANLNYKQKNEVVLPLLLILLFPNILASIYYSQIISLFLFLLLSLLYYINSWKAGIFIPVLFFVKPLAVFFIFYFIFFKKWKTVAAAAVTGSIILAATAVAFGTQNFINYFISPPTDRIPDYIYFQSSALFGVLKRLQKDIPSYLSISSIKIIYYMLSTVLIGVTFIALRKLHRASNMLSFLVFIPLALLIYPGTYFNYNILTLPVILYIFTQKLFKHTALNFAIIFLLYLIGIFNAFLFNLVLWSILINWPALLNYCRNNFFLRASLRRARV